MSRKEILRAGLFLMLALLLILTAWLVLDRKLACHYTLPVHGFFNEEPESMDVIFYGSSHAYCSIDPLALKDETGLESYVLATQQQPLTATYQYVKQSLETQSPKLLVLELCMVKQEQEWATDAVLRDSIDPLPWGHGKAALIRELVPAGERGSYYFNLAKYHGRWKELSGQSLDFSYLNGRHEDRGFIRFGLSRPAECWALSYEGVEPAELIEANVQQLLRIKALAAEHGAELAFIIAPYEGAQEDAAFFKAMELFAAQQGIKLLDFNLEYDAAGFDGAVDFYDPNHLNASGANKATRYFGRWAMENFDIE